MKLHAGKGGAEPRDLPIDDCEVVDEQRCVAGTAGEIVGTATADEQHAVGVGGEPGRDASHRLAHAISSFFSSTRSSLPLGLRGSSSRQMIALGCMKLG